MEVYGYSHHVMKWRLGWSMMLNLFGGGGGVDVVPKTNKILVYTSCQLCVLTDSGGQKLKLVSSKNFREHSSSTCQG